MARLVMQRVATCLPVYASSRSDPAGVQQRQTPPHRLNGRSREILSKSVSFSLCVSLSLPLSFLSVLDFSKPSSSQGRER